MRTITETLKNLKVINEAKSNLPFEKKQLSKFIPLMKSLSDKIIEAGLAKTATEPEPKLENYYGERSFHIDIFYTGVGMKAKVTDDGLFYILKELGFVMKEDNCGSAGYIGTKFINEDFGLHLWTAVNLYPYEEEDADQLHIRAFLADPEEVDDDSEVNKEYDDAEDEDYE